MYRQIISIVLAFSIIGNVFMAPTTDPNRNKQTILNYGRTLNRDISRKLVNDIYAFNGKIRQYAVNIPSNSPLQELTIPLQFTSNLGNMMAPYLVRRMVSKPMEIITETIAQWIDQLSVSSKSFSDFVAISLGNVPKK